LNRVPGLSGAFGSLMFGPAHLDVLIGQSGHRVGELHGGYAVQLEQAAPAERREHLGQVAH